LENGDSNQHPDYWLKLKLFLELLEKHQLLARRQQEYHIKQQSKIRQEEYEREVQEEQRLAELRKERGY